jgi:hypothetical protein
LATVDKKIDENIDEKTDKKSDEKSAAESWLRGSIPMNKGGARRVVWQSWNVMRRKFNCIGSKTSPVETVMPTPVCDRRCQHRRATAKA